MFIQQKDIMHLLGIVIRHISDKKMLWKRLKLLRIFNVKNNELREMNNK